VIEIPDLTGLPLITVVAFALLLAAVDTVFNIILALARGDFSAAYVLRFLTSHILLKVFPIVGLAVIGNGSEALGIPSIGAASLAATGALALYLLETLGSLRTALSTTSPSL
jgi:hypothetical protein